MACDQQYDVSEKMQRLFQEKQKQRLAAKEYYMKLLYNPYRGPDGVPFDPALQRFSAMSSYHVEYFRPTAKTFSKYFLYIAPVALLYWYMHTSRAKREQLLRSGVVSYHDRGWKFFY